MIILKPSQTIRRAYFRINWNTLSLVYSALFDTVYKRKKKRVYKIYVKHRPEDDYSYYTFDAKHPCITMLLGLSCRQFHATFLHEFRHFIQNKVMKIQFGEREYAKTY